MVRILCAQWCMLRAFDARATLRACGAAYGANRACIYGARMVCMWRAHGAHHVVHVARISLVYRTHMVRNGEHLMCICRACRAHGVRVVRIWRAHGVHVAHMVSMVCKWGAYGTCMVRMWCALGAHMARA